MNIRRGLAVAALVSGFLLPVTPAVADDPQSASPAVAAAAVPADGTRGTSYIGVIPRNPGDCGGNEYISIYMDDEDSNNSSYMSGWTGAMRHRRTSYVNGTYLNFCRIDGSSFKGLEPPKWVPKSDYPNYAYSVLKLDTTCPNGSADWSVQIDNEDKNNQNVTVGNISPSAQDKNTRLQLCLFTPTGTATGDMPGFPRQPTFTYGVFGGMKPAPAPRGGSYWIQTGLVVTDDENNNNINNSSPKTTPALDTVNPFFPWGGRTSFSIARVADRADLCVPKAVTLPWTTLRGDYDGANCLVMPVPTGFTPVISGNAYYVNAKAGPSPCPLLVSVQIPNTPLCFMGWAPGGRSAFIWGTSFYYGE